MVHSGANTPLMPTTPSASPQLALCAQGAPLQAQSPHLSPSEEGLAKPPGDLVTSSSDAIAAPSQVLLAPDDLAELGPESPLSPDHFQAAVNGRSSGRRRTPKACDCCGPNGKGHNVPPTPSRGRGRTRGRGRGQGRGRGRGRGRGSCNGDTPKRTVGGHPTGSLTFELTDDEDNDDEEDGDEETEESENNAAKATSALGIDGQSDTSFDLPSESACQAGPIKSPVSIVKRGDPQKKEVAIAIRGGRGQRRGRGAAGARGPRGRGRGAGPRRGRGAAGAAVSGNLETKERAVEGGGGGVGQREGSGGALVGAAGVAAQKASAAGADGPAGPGPMAVCQLPEEMELGVSPAADLHPASATNGNGLHFSGEGEERGSEADAEAGAPSGGEVGEAVELPPQQVDTAMSPITLSGGSPPGAAAPRADPDGDSAPMETAAFHEARSPAPSLAPIAVQSGEHGWALWDHRRYCLQGTWGPGAGGHGTGEPQEDQQSTSETEDCAELLTEMLHEFLESFFLKYGSFIPLSETDVLEHLKKKTNMDLNKRKLDIPGEIRRFKAGLASAPVAGFMVTYNKHTLSLEDLGTMEEQNWLNDQVINMYGELIMEATQRRVHFFNSFFHKQLVAKGYEGVKRWTKKVDLFSKWLLLVPIHLEIHWSLITVNTATKTIGYYDSQGVVFKHTIDNIMKYLQSEAEEKQQTNYQKGWKMLIIRGIPQQKNDSDCGVFVLEYCRRLSMKEPLLFSQDDMPRIRKRIYKELCDCRLSD